MMMMMMGRLVNLITALAVVELTLIATVIMTTTTTITMGTVFLMTVPSGYHCLDASSSSGSSGSTNNNNNNNNAARDNLLDISITSDTYGEPSMGPEVLSEVAPFDEVDRRSPSTGKSCEETSSCDDIAGFEAIRALHRQLDDDASGTVDISETDEFIRDELQNPNGNERQIKAFHGSDNSISVLEMWLSWKSSEVHNWTVEETVAWLVDSVELPQYARLFHENRIDGRALPRMAVQNNAFLTTELGIKDPISKQKLVLKAMDVVLFGPQRNHNWLKDVILAVVLIFATTIVWYLYRQNRRSQLQMRKMMKDLDSLQKAEDALLEMQQQLDKARIEQENLQEEISNKKKDVAYSDPDSLIYKLQEEVRFLHEELAKAQNMPRGMAPPQLQHWLQLTHEIELKNYHAKKAAAENQLRKAKDECDKLRRKGQSFMGPFRLTHGGSIDDIDTTILKAKQALSDVTHDLSERLHRWRQIERLCGFNIVSNRGLVQLEALLHGHHVFGGALHHPSPTSSMPLGGNNNNNNNNNNNIPTAGSTKSVISRSGSEGTMSDDDSPGSSSYNNMSSVASTGSIPVMPAKPNNTAYGVPMGGRHGGIQPPQSLYGDYYAQQLHTMQHHSALVQPPLGCGGGGSGASGGGPVVGLSQAGVLTSISPMGQSAVVATAAAAGPLGSLGGTSSSGSSVGQTMPVMRRDLGGGEPNAEGQPPSAPVLFHVGPDSSASPTLSEGGNQFGPPVMNLSGAVLLKQSSLDGSTDGALDEDPNRLSTCKPRRKGSALMNALRNSFTSASTLVDSEDNSSRGSTPALDVDTASQRSIRKRTGVLGAFKKISRGSKEKPVPVRDS